MPIGTSSLILRARKAAHSAAQKHCNTSDLCRQWRAPKRAQNSEPLLLGFSVKDAKECAKECEEALQASLRLAERHKQVSSLAAQKKVRKKPPNTSQPKPTLYRNHAESSAWEANNKNAQIQTHERQNLAWFEAHMTFCFSRSSG